MKFVFISTGVKGRNGSINRCLVLGEQLVKMGHTVINLTMYDKENLELYGETYRGMEFIYAGKTNILRQLSKIYKLRKIKDVDFVHCMGAGLSIFLPALVCKKILMQKFQLIVDYEDRQSMAASKFEKPIYTFFEKVSFKTADKIICASEELTNEYKTYFKKTYYLPFALDSNPETDKFRNISSVKKNDKNKTLELCYMGVLTEMYKEQIEFLIDAAPYLKKEIPNFRINIAGTGSCKKYFEDKTEKIGFSNEIIFHGFVPEKELYSFFSKMDILTFYVPDIPINRYRCPYKAYIYCLTGLPIVSTRVGEVYKILSLYPNSIFFELNNFKSFVDAIKKAKDTNNIVPEDFYINNNWQKRTKEYFQICMDK